MMPEIIFNGVKFGIVLAFLVGPVFFTIIQTSVERGFIKGVMVALGVSLSDTLYVAICYLGLFQFLNEPAFRVKMAYAGGAILILFGLYHMLVKSRKSSGATVRSAHEKNFMKYIGKGFVINGITPMVLIFWIGTLSVATIDMGYSRGYELLIFFASLLGTVLTTDILKAYLADKLRVLVTHRFLMIINILVGICLLIFGIKLLLMSKTGFTMGVPTP